MLFLYLRLTWIEILLWLSLVANDSHVFESPIFPCFVSFRFSFFPPSFVIILCFVLFFLLVFSSHFVSSWLFPSVQISFHVFTLFFYYFRCALPFILYSDIYCSLCFLWLLYEPWAAKWRGFLRKSPSSLRYRVVSCSLGWRDETLRAFWFQYYIFFYLCWKPNFYLIGITGSFVWEK